MPHPDEEETTNSNRDIGKFILQGAFLAVLILVFFVTVGVIWSLRNYAGVKAIDHLYNGWVFATLANLLSLFLGISAGISALMYLGGNARLNFIIGGFAISHFAIVGMLWCIGAYEMKKPPMLELSPTEKILEFRKRFEKQD